MRITTDKVFTSDPFVGIVLWVANISDFGNALIQLRIIIFRSIMTLTLGNAETRSGSRGLLLEPLPTVISSSLTRGLIIQSAV